jgi:chromosome segregation ATPase
MPRDTVKSLKEQIENLQNQLLASEAARRAANEEVKASDASLKEARSKFAELKERLHYSELDNARLRGFVQRVHETDDAASECEEVTCPTNRPASQVPRSKLARSANTRFDQIDTFGRDRDRQLAERGHWTDW